ncbi:hypothetical protein [Undibacterium curvum]|uniref:Uncharacterized protein n=1 Tax=Undibacterium curvum TaxID=2762294 RepID=A0ABR7A4S3_9BURK|nr:hypothetical protein [Undibacterium curvum]MBC3931662.1 hypothetical protein [Undibacterium curvum]
MSNKLTAVVARNQKNDNAIIETFTQEEIQLVLNYRSLQDSFQVIMYRAIAHMTKTVGKKPALSLVQSFNQQRGNV